MYCQSVTTILNVKVSVAVVLAICIIYVCILSPFPRLPPPPSPHSFPLRVNNPESIKKRSKLVLPAPQISDAELEEVHL